MGSWLEIDLEAIQANARALALLAAPARLCAVVKSNAYGHGLVPVARALSGAGVDRLRLAVFAPEEGLVLREAGLACPILVVGPAEDSELADMAARDLEAAILSEDDVERFASHRLRAHLKVETGVSRFGVQATALRRAVQRSGDLGVRVIGIYSHLANAEDLDKTFTMLQVERLNEAVIAARATEGLERHIAASAAAILWPETRLDMVRCGIAVYGHWPSPDVQAAAEGKIRVKRALRWFVRIAQVRDVEAGQPVGYGCEFVPERASVIAVLPLGYADGLPRSAGGGKLQVLVSGGRAPIVGRICMNACMVDVTDVQPRPVRGERAEIDVDAAARAAGTINYEILARLSPALERRFS